MLKIVHRVGKGEDVAATAQVYKAGCATLQRGICICIVSHATVQKGAVHILVVDPYSYECEYFFKDIFVFLGWKMPLWGGFWAMVVC